MSLGRASPLFPVTIALSAALVLGELYLIHDRWSASTAAQTTLHRRTLELAAMSSTVPPPSNEIAAAIEEDLARAQRALAAMQAGLAGRGPAAERLRSSKAPMTRTDAYFDLATYVEQMREQAKRKGVTIGAEAARFGFAAYANEAPELERIESVFRQRQIAQFLLEALFGARPALVIAMKRELTITKAEHEARKAAAADARMNGFPAPDAAQLDAAAVAAIASLPEGADYFALNPRAAARAPGFVETVGFRVVFAGETAALRSFLNRLAAFELPVIVREVEVEPLGGEEIAAHSAEISSALRNAAAENYSEPSMVLTLDSPPAASSLRSRSARPSARAPHATPIVAKPLSRFAVTVEYVAFASPSTYPVVHRPPQPQL